MADGQAATTGTRELPEWAVGNTHRGGPHFGDLVEQIRSVMDAARQVDADDDLTRELIEDLGKITARMEAASVSVEQAPADSRKDLPSRGNVSLPPITVRELGPEGVVVETTFRPFHMGRGLPTAAWSRCCSTRSPATQPWNVPPVASPARPT
ncbi:hypothetical protein [Nocardioides alcanivorans]|uniref:hypothetical protein n=1 Tax=Nocardioides alcanivorans TaxID=2897352 RepID=UPI001F1F6475|nr:hypothetical protein [Nocardioides alcanivorans]